MYYSHNVAHPVSSPHVVYVPVAPAPRPQLASDISFTLNGSQVTISNPDPTMSLNEYLRSTGLTGTKIMCGEGGCGACTVMMSSDNHPTGTQQRSINSCLRPLCSVDGTSITTVEGIGSQAKGFHPVQERIADNNGSQCGYCTPGMVMEMYSLLAANPSPTAQQVEENFDGNICRCTGYRPILSAMKTFASDGGSVGVHSCKGDSCCSKHFFPDIEDLKIAKHKPLKEEHMVHGKNHKKKQNKPPLCIQAATTVWVVPPDLATLVNLVTQYASTNTPVKLVVGNTSSGVFKNQNYNIFIDITKVPDLQQVTVGTTSFTIGAAVTLTDLLVLFENWINTPALSGKTNLLPQLVTHIKKVANPQVRNVGSWAGNIMMAHDNVDFPSDVFTVFAAAGATLTTVDSYGRTTGVDLISFLGMNMAGSVVVSVDIPFSVPNQQFNSFKVALRHVNAHALVNSGYNAILDSSLNFATQPIIVYGGIGPHAIRMTQTEQYLVGKNVKDLTALQGALKILAQEAYPDPGPIGKQAYRYSLMTSLFYKFWLSLIPASDLKPELVSAAVPFERPVSSGVQSFQTNPGEFPVSAPIPKLKAREQASGEVLYVGDISPPQGTLYGAFVTSTVANATISSVDATAALQSPGVVSFISAKDITGSNNWSGNMEIFASNTVYHYGQPIGLIIADTQRHADEAIDLVVVSYTNVQPPVLSIAEAIANNAIVQNSEPIIFGDVATGLAASDYNLSGTINFGPQYYFFMETHNVLVTPVEGGYNVYASTQAPSTVQNIVSKAINVSASTVNVIVGSVGGAYGGKGTHSLLTPAAAAIASQILKKPIKIKMSLEANMQSVGHRSPARVDYTVGFMDSGVVTSLQATWYLDGGYANVASFMSSMAMSVTNNNYNIANLKITGSIVKTNLPANSAMRAPGCKEGILAAEEIMWNVAKYLNKDPQDVKELNFFQDGQTMPDKQKLVYYNLPTMWNTIKVTSDFEARQQAVAQYNQTNRWTKKGIAIANSRYDMNYAHAQFGVIVNISATDGLITVTHSGCEIGQGISTKVAQVVAYELSVPLSIITVTVTSTATIPNAGQTAGSVTSSMNCQAAIQACQLLAQRLQPLRVSMPSATWQQLIAAAAKQGIDLQAKGWTNQPPNPNGPDTYLACAVACVETQVDVLTGETQILRCDLLFDAGISLNPAVDLGQAEGGFVQGYGNILTEEMDFDPNTGQLITNGTWEYKPPSSRDIPIDYRVTILKNAPNPYGVLSSKATGEPPLVSSCAVLLAVKDAIESARSTINVTTGFDLDTPCTVDKISTWCQVDTSQFYF